MNCHSQNKLVGLWVNKDAFLENDEYYERVIKAGVDFICTDYPLDAMRVRDMIESLDSNHSSDSTLDSGAMGSDSCSINQDLKDPLENNPQPTEPKTVNVCSD